MTETISIPDKPEFGNIKNHLRWMQDLVFRDDFYKNKADFLEATIKIWRELNQIEERYDSQVKRS